MLGRGDGSSPKVAAVWRSQSRSQWCSAPSARRRRGAHAHRHPGDGWRREAPLAHVYDGYLVHSRAGGAPIRDDLGVPVLVFMTETDVNFSNGAVRQPDTSTYRLWEVPGTAHFDQYGLSIGPEDTGDGQGAVAVLDSMQHPTNQPGGNFTCGAPINTGPAHFVLDAAFHHLEQWVADGTPPPKAPRLQTTSTAPLTFAADQHGNTLGGIRTPALDAPVATLTGNPPGGSVVLLLVRNDGRRSPPSKLQTLYPDHRAFVGRVDACDELGASRRVPRRRGREGTACARRSSPTSRASTHGVR